VTLLSNTAPDQKFTSTVVDLHAAVQILAKGWSTITQQVKDALAKASL
jgi:hypothetical protein